MAAKYPHVVKAETYAREVIEGKIPACKWVIAACQRHFDDKEKSKTRPWKYKFDRAKAERICIFAEKMPHIKGRQFVGKLITLEPWQCFIFCSIFGWVNKITGFRRFRRADIMVPRKNAKSTMASIIGNYMLAADGEAGAEVYAGATSQGQAFEVFLPAKRMIEKSPDFQAYFGVVCGARHIAQLQTNSFFKPLIGKPGDGASPHCSIHDEYHEHDSDEQVDTMRTGMGARQQPLQLIITTAGDNISGPCYMEFEDGKKILDGVVVSDEVFVIIFTMDEDDDWTSELALRKANPNYGVSVDADFLHSMQIEAMQTPRRQAIFKTKHLNIWVGAMDAYFDMHKWRSCADTTLKMEDFHGQPCIIALDLASKIDLTAIEILFKISEKEFVGFSKFYLPAAAVEAAGRDHYRSWRDEGWLTVTDGEIIDYEVIRNDLLAFCSLFEVIEMSYDPWGVTQLVTELQKEGVNMVEFGQSPKNMSEPMKQLDALIRSGAYRHNGNPVSSWCLSNVVAALKLNDNVHPNKTRPENKIDGAITKIIAVGRHYAPRETVESYTANNGVIFV